MKGLSMFAKVSMGLVATIVVAAAIYLLGIRPTLQNIKYHEENIAQLEQKVAQIPRARELVRRAQERVEQANRDLAVIDRTKMPVNTYDLSDRLKAWSGIPTWRARSPKSWRRGPKERACNAFTQSQFHPPRTTRTRFQHSCGFTRWVQCKCALPLSRAC
jgi:hypothetical protein